VNSAARLGDGVDLTRALLAIDFARAFS